MQYAAAAVSLVLALSFASAAHAQAARNAAFVEVGGSAVVASVNYERRLADQWFGRIGASSVTSDTSNATTFIVPVTASWVSRPESNHHLELGGGVTIAAGDRQDFWESETSANGKFSTAVLNGIAGYRYQKPRGGFQFRAVLTPFLGGGDFLPWAGVSFGYAW